MLCRLLRSVMRPPHEFYIRTAIRHVGRRHRRAENEIRRVGTGGRAAAAVAAAAVAAGSSSGGIIGANSTNEMQRSLAAGPTAATACVYRGQQSPIRKSNPLAARRLLGLFEWREGDRSALADGGWIYIQLTTRKVRYTNVLDRRAATRGQSSVRWCREMWIKSPLYTQSGREKERR